MTIPITVVAIQSITPQKVTPKRSRRISVPGELPPAMLGAHFRMILYFRPVSEKEGSAQAAAAMIKDSLGVALIEEPMLAGRLRRSESAAGGGGGGGWELRVNDAGVRLVQALAAADIAEVLDAGDREEREWGLAYWKDVEKDNTDQSALFYIQVTEFQRSDYSIGISCSLLLADPLFLTRFLVKWAHLHRRMITADSIATNSLFHLGRFNISPLPAHLVATPAVARHTSTALLRLPPAASPTAAVARSLSGSASLVMHSYHAGDLKVEIWDESKDGGEGRDGGVDVQWAELSSTELAIGAGDAPVDATYRIVPGGKEGVVVVMDPGGGSDMLVSITIPDSAKP